MRSKIYKSAFLLMAIIGMLLPAMAQVPATAPVKPAAPAQSVRVSVSAPMVMKANADIQLKNLDIQLSKVDKQLSSYKVTVNGKNVTHSISKTLKVLDRELSKSLNAVNSKVMLALADVDMDIKADCDVTVKDDEVNTGDLDEQIKTYSKTYSVDNNDVLDIDNRYGKVTINTWNRNEFKVDVQVKVATNKEGQAKKMLDNVSIIDGKQGSIVFFKTKFNNEDNGGVWSLFSSRGSGNSVRIIEINYTVYMPAKNALNVSNRYGSTVLPDLYGKVVVDNAYGNLTAKALSNPGNDIKVKYGSATIENLVGSDLYVAYGNLNLAECDRLKANVSYGSAKIGTIKTSGNINVKYSGGLSINAVDKNIRNLVVNSSYSGVKVGVPEPLNADFDVTVHYGSFNYNNSNAINVVNKSPTNDDRSWNPTKTFRGKVGKGDSDKVITINSNYGSVKFE